MRKGRIVILLAGRRSGKKAVIVKTNDDGGKKVSICNIIWYSTKIHDELGIFSQDVFLSTMIF